MPEEPVKLALVGIGKIARDEHLPTLAKTDRFELVAAVSRNAGVEGVASFTALEAAFADMPAIKAVSLATPPVPRFQQALQALRAGKHVMLEKPPGATLSEVHALAEEARRHGRTLFASWHSRAAACVAEAKAWLAERHVESAHIEWKEDIREWHPGQDWILAAGGMGVFDPGINALSLITEILPVEIVLRGGVLDVPENRQSPIRADLQFKTTDGRVVTANFDHLYDGEAVWDIKIVTNDGTLTLREGGAKMFVDGESVELPPHDEYAGLYDRFADLIAAGESDVDLTPFRLVADAMMLCERRVIESFEW